MNSDKTTLTFKEAAAMILEGQRLTVGRYSSIIVLEFNTVTDYYEFEVDGAHISGPGSSFLTFSAIDPKLPTERTEIYGHQDKSSLIRRALKLQGEGYWRVMSCPFMDGGLWNVRLQAVDLQEEPEPTFHEVL